METNAHTLSNLVVHGHWNNAFPSASESQSYDRVDKTILATILYGTLTHRPGWPLSLVDVASLGSGIRDGRAARVAKASANRWLSFRSFYTYVLRGTPLYVNCCSYTRASSLMAVRSTPFLSSFFQGCVQLPILAFTLNTAPTRRDFFRSDQATPRGELEAARAFGMSGWTLYRCIILPSAFSGGALRLIATKSS